MERNASNDEQNRKFPKQEALSQLIVNVTSFFKGPMIKILTGWDKSFYNQRELLFLLLYSLITNSPNEFEKLIKSKLVVKNDKQLFNVKLFQELNVLLVSNDLSLLKKSNLYSRLMKGQQDLANAEDQLFLVSRLQEIAKPLYMKLVDKMDVHDYLSLLVKKESIKNAFILKDLMGEK